VKTPEIPRDEQARLRSLKSLDILDTPAEERFDRLTRMARRLFGVPIALVSLIDENRQWFKSAAGLDVRETPRAISFCGHAILDDQILVVPDARADARFSDNPLVLGDPEIRFYAGCPLRAPDGSRLGTFCIIDRTPRALGAEDLEMLRDLAALAEREITTVELATMDDLTDISNRRGFLMLAQKGLNLCARQGIPATLAFFDINGFKLINDRFGHAEGDRALAVFADHLRHVFRDSDLFARLGGDEFVVLLTNTDRTLAESIVARFRQSLARRDGAADRGYALDFAHGIVEFDPARHRDVEALLADGDAQMYAHKRERPRAEGRHEA